MTPLVIKLLALLAIFACTFLLIQQVSQMVVNSRRQRRQVNRRLEYLRAGLTHEQVVQLLRRRTAALAGNTVVARVLNRYYRLHAVADVRIGAGQAVTISLVATLSLFLVLLLMAASLGFTLSLGTLLLVACFAVALGAGLPYALVARRAAKRTKAMEEQFPVALDIFTRALRSGHPVAAAIELLTTEMTDPIGSEFGIVFDEVSYGSDLNTALHNLADRWDLPDIQMFAVCLSVQTETGGNLAEILTNLSQVIRERAAMYMKVRALSSEGRMSAWMLSVLPVLTFVALFMINPGFFLDVAADPIFTYGFSILLVLYAIGVIWLRKLVDLKV